MRIDIYYFSGTGNTAWLTQQLAEQLRALGNKVNVFSCEDVSTGTIDHDSCGMAGIIFPVHSSFAPSIFRDFLLHFQNGGGNPLFAITTAGYMAGDTAWYRAKPLKEKGYKSFLLGNVIMANNLHLPMLSPLRVTPLKKMPRKLGKARKKIHRLNDLIHHKKNHIEGANPFGRVLGVVQRFVADRFEASTFKGFFADENCSRCVWCVRYCPVKNIDMNSNAIRFHDNCILCMRCFSFCPKQAIQSSSKTRNTGRYRRYPGPEGKRFLSLHKQGRINER